MVGSSTILEIVPAGAATILFLMHCDRLSESFNCTVTVDILRFFTAEFCRIARGDSVDALLVVYVVIPPCHICYLSNSLIGLNDRGNHHPRRCCLR